MATSSVKSAVTRVDWTALTSKLKPETVAALNGFRRRHADLSRTVSELREAQTTVDFAPYKSTLKNQKVVSEAERAFKAFKPATYDLSEQLRIIDEAEAKAVSRAKTTAAKVNTELTELKSLLKNIETARPLEDLTVDDVVKAMPHIDAKVEKLIKRGQWHVPGYTDKFGDFSVGF